VFWRGNDPIKVPASFPDGTSTTVMVYERYSQCRDTINHPWGKADVAGANRYGASDWVKSSAYAVDPTKPISEKNTFKRFQLLPREPACDAHTAQAMHRPGINALMGDASVHVVRPEVSAATWHAAVTPNGKDIVGADW
jgi:hypothetical protein